MNFFEHSLISVRKFGGDVEDYLPIHRFIDSSKLLVPNYKHRVLLHHTSAVTLCENHLETSVLKSGVLIRDVVFEHLKEDFAGFCPTLRDWYDELKTDNELGTYEEFYRNLFHTDFAYLINKDIRFFSNSIQKYLDTIQFKKPWMTKPDKKEIEWLASINLIKKNDNY